MQQGKGNLMKTKRVNAGFTLIELMVVVVIIGVIAAFAYPNFTKYLTETRRSDATIAVLQLSARLEKFFTECSNYTTALTGSLTACTGLGNGTNNYPSNSPEGYYSLAVAAPNPPCPAANGIDTCYVITAAPNIPGKQANDAGCATIVLNSVGVKSATGTEVNRCWRN